MRGLVLTLAGALLAGLTGPALASAAPPPGATSIQTQVLPPSVFVEDGQTVAGTVALAAADAEVASVRVGEADLATSPMGSAFRLVGEVSSYDSANDYSLEVNGVELPLPKTTIAGGGAGTTWGAFDSGPLPAGLLRADGNALRFVPGPNATGVPDRVYLRDLAVVLADGAEIVDPGSAGTRIDVGYDRPLYEFGYPFNVVVPAASVTSQGWLWDTTTVRDGMQPVTFTLDDETTVTIRLRVDNQPLGLDLVDGQHLQGVVPLNATGDAPVEVRIGEEVLEPSVSTQSATFHALSSSYDAPWTYQLFVNDVEVTLPKGPIGSSGTTTFGELASSRIPTGTLRAGTNTLRFVPGPNGSGVPDRVYLKDVRLVLADGTEIIDPTSRDTIINVGYDRPTYEFEYPVTMELAAPTLETNAWSWDTSIYPDGEYVVSVSDPTGSLTRTVEVDNTAPALTVTTPADGSRHQGSPFVIDATASDPIDGDLALTLTLDGEPVENGSRWDPEKMTNGEHTLLVEATDSHGLTSQRTVTFETWADTPFAPTDPSPADGDLDVPTRTTSLGVTVADPTGDPLDVTFKLARQQDFGNGAGLEARQGSTTDGEPALGSGQRLPDPEAVAALEEADGERVETTEAERYPFQQFDVAVPEEAATDRDLAVSWTGRTRPGHRVVLSVFDHRTETWVEAASAVAGEDDLTLRGSVRTGPSVQDGKATVQVQVLPGYIAPTNDGAVKFAWMTDTQKLAESDPETFDKEAQWIVDQRESENLAYMFLTGDIVDDVDQEFQWVNASESLQILDDADVPYGLVPGNHDFESGYSHYRKYFGEERFADDPWYGGTASDNVQHYDYISTPEADYMFVYLTWRASAAEWAWVKDAIASHPDANVIIGTHEQFDPTGQLTGQGTRFMSEIIEPYDNVVAIMSGHKDYSYVWVNRLGDGRIVLQVQVNWPSVKAGSYSGGAGFMRTVELDPDAQTFTNRTFTVLDVYPTAGGPDHAWPLTGCESLTEAPSIEREMTEECITTENFVRPITLQKAERSLATDHVEVTARTEEVIAELDAVASGARAEVPAGELSLDSDYSWYVEVADEDGHSVVSDVWSFSTVAATPTTMSADDLTVVDGGTVRLSAALDPVAATGSVLFRSGDDVLCEAVLAGGVASCEAAAMPGVGTHSIEVEYAGDHAHAASSTTLRLTVTARPTDPTDPTDPGPIGVRVVVGDLRTTFGKAAGIPVTLVAERSSTGTPRGVLRIERQGRLLATQRIDGFHGRVTLPAKVVRGLAAGRNNLVVSFSGGSGFTADRSSFVVRVAKAKTVLRAKAPRVGVRGRTATVTVRLKVPGDLRPTGRVVVRIGSTTKVVEAKAGVTRVRLTIDRQLRPGSQKVVVWYAGSRHLKAATQQSRIRIR
ncbi:Ig-like domain repeat protein [Nocardioides sp. W7]|uniref:Ig-like domain repeat protein n=1 Tax=Nocardioides sp. W7 TaxID=2931390 RepID=UPI001FD19ADD|nr:Ig-like domain repeat protein [Nocardioides sp. W7]